MVEHSFEDQDIIACETRALYMELIKVLVERNFKIFHRTVTGQGYNEYPNILFNRDKFVGNKTRENTKTHKYNWINKEQFLEKAGIQIIKSW